MVRVQYLSIDPTIRTWMDDAPGYLPPIELGEVVRSGGIGRVVATESDQYAVGDTVFGMLGWQDHAVVDEAGHTAQVIPDGVDPKAALSVFGVTGMTAYFGLLDVGELQPGDTVVVSAAAGATGSVVGQIARLKGAGRVVGHRRGAGEVRPAGRRPRLRRGHRLQGRRRRGPAPASCARTASTSTSTTWAARSSTPAWPTWPCGPGSCAAGPSRPTTTASASHGLQNTFTLIMKRARMEGFLVLDYLDRFPEAQAEMFGWVAEGQVRHAEHMVDGLASAPDALNLLFTGGNTGKVIVAVDDA